MSFKDEFAKLKPGPARDALVFKAITSLPKATIEKSLVPITVNGPNNTKITYKVMPDYIMIDGIRVPMAGNTAQQVANFFGMNLPTPKMVNQIYDAANVKLTAKPMSGGGIIGGKYYSGKEVVEHKISDSDTTIAYNDRIAEDLAKQNNTGLVAGHMKDITTPMADDKLGLYGFYNKDGKPIQNSAFTPHDTTVHTEYGAGVRLVGNNITVTLPDGSKKTLTMEEFSKTPYFKAISDNPNLKKYNTKPIQQAATPQSSNKPNQTDKPQQPVTKPNSLDELNNMINQLLNVK